MFQRSWVFLTVLSITTAIPVFNASNTPCAPWKEVLLWEAVVSWPRRHTPLIPALRRWRQLDSWAGGQPGPNGSGGCTKISLCAAHNEDALNCVCPWTDAMAQVHPSVQPSLFFLMAELFLLWHIYVHRYVCACIHTCMYYNIWHFNYLTNQWH